MLKTSSLYKTLASSLGKGRDVSEILRPSKALSPGDTSVSHQDLWPVPEPPAGAAHTACAPSPPDLRTLPHGPGAHRGCGGAAAHQGSGAGVPEGRRGWRKAAEGPGE